MPISVVGNVSKIKLANGNYVALKDAQARADLVTLLGEHALTALGAAAWKDVTNSISGTGLIDAATVKTYVDEQVGSIHKFDVVVADELPTASESTMYKLYLIPKVGATSPNAKEEWITIRSGSEGAYTYAWEKIGDTEIDLSGYVQKTCKIAGIDLQDDIEVEELQLALNLGDLAYADTASTVLSTIDSITMNDITVSGDIEIDSTSTAATLTKGDYTPAGTVSAPTINVTSETIAVGTELVGGSVATFTEGAFTPAAIQTGFYTAGTTPTKEADTFTPGSFSKGSAISAATEGIVASVNISATAGDDDYEVLVFESAETDEVMDFDATYTAPTFEEGEFDGGSMATVDVTKFSGGSKAADQFNGGSLPTLDVATIYNVSDVTASAPTFTGTTAANILVTGVNYDKASGSTSFSQTITPTVKTYTRTDKTITVTPDVE